MSNPLIQILDRTGEKKNLPLESTAVDQPPLDLEAVRARLAQSNGQGYWRSLEELSGDENFTRFLEREFPRQAPRDMAPLARRDFLKLMGAALALAGVSGCAFQPAEQIVSHVKSPEDQQPGIPQFYATAYTHNSYALGVLAESNMGRPTKIEGNPDHPASLGATDAFTQASLLNLYDPDRSQTIRKFGNQATWDDFVGAVTSALQELAPVGGQGLHILTETVTSPTMASQLREIQRRFPRMAWHQYDPITRDGVREGARAAFGSATHLTYRFDQARVVLSLDANFLLEEPGHVRYARDFAQMRRVRSGSGTDTSEMNRLYVAESTPTITGAMADHRVPMKASAVQSMAAAVAAKLGVSGATGTVGGEAQKFVDAVVADLQANRGRSIVIAGSHQPAAVHALAHAINGALGNLNTTVIGHEPVEAQPIQQTDSLRNLHTALRNGAAKVLLIVGGNPVYDAPSDLDFVAVLDPKRNKQAPLSVHLSPHDDETSAWCTWHLPEAHYLETWGDARAFDGTVSIVQPLIQPLYPDARSPIEVLTAFLPTRTQAITSSGSAATTQAGANNASLQVMPSGMEIVQAYWRQARPGGDFGKNWQKWVHDGLIPGTQAARRPLTLVGGVAATFSAPASTLGQGDIEVMFRPDPTIWDGRYANNAWLQELPKPLTKTVWDNAAILSVTTAQKLNVSDDDLVQINVGTGPERMVQAGVVILPGHPDDAVTVHLGYGRTRVGKIGNGPGFNAYKLRLSNTPWFVNGKVTAVGSRFQIARTSHHNMIDTSGGKAKVDGIHDRPLIQVATFEQWKKNPESVVHEEVRKSLPVMGLQQEGTIDRKLEKHHQTDGEGGQSHTEKSQGETTSGSKKKPKGFSSFYPDGRDTVLSDEQISYAWAMSIDTNTCIGCNSCVIACQAENNSATTGKDQVLMGRTMHWIRIDTYYHGEVDNPNVYFQPVMCMHCEKAPCEPVCPVEATLHSPEGINEMIYNRCIGTRYCSNNCPYKVRRFNYLQFSDQNTPQIQLMANPDVTVRSRGVMEKCTYCVQRVNQARIQAEKEDRLVRDGDVVTACQQSCPTDAITFGDIRNTNSKVARLKTQPHDYGLLTELNTYPRTTYLAKIENPNPALPRQRSQSNSEAIGPEDDTSAFRPADHADEEHGATETGH